MENEGDWDDGYAAGVARCEEEIKALEGKLHTLEQNYDLCKAELAGVISDAKAQALRLGRYAKLEAACREWKPVYESLSYGEPEPMPDDPITAALKELDSAVERQSQFGPVRICDEPGCEAETELPEKRFCAQHAYSPLPE